nr:MAG TPA: minor tail protein [Caudoviricetes sp.]
MATDIGPKIGIDGEKEFRKELTAINAQLRALAAEGKTVEATYDGQTESVESLTAKSKVLNQQIETQRKAIEKIEYALQKARESYDENDEHVQKWKAVLANANTQLVAMEKQLEKTKIGLEEVSEGFQKASSRLNTAGNALTVGLTTPLVAAGAAAVNYASDTEEALNKVDVAFGSSAESVKAWSDTTLTSIGLAKGTALDMAALYGDMATSMGFSEEAAADMAKELVNLAGDLASFKNISVDEVNTALKSVFTGETESLKNLGVVMTEVNLENYALSKGLSQTYQSMDQNEKVALRYQYVLDMTKNAQGDFARTTDSTANQIRILQESLKEAAASIGEDLLPIVTPLIQKLGELTQSLSGLDSETQRTIVQTSLFLAALGPMLKLTGGITSAVNTGITAYKALKAAHTAATASQLGLNAAMAANPVGAVVTAVGGLVAVLGSLAAATALTAEKQADLNKELEETEKARLSGIADIKEQENSTLALVSVLEDLTAVEGKTEAQKQAILDVVADLNEAVPNLSLAYDEQADSLNMTADAIRNLAAAEAQRQIQQENMDAVVEQYRIRLEAEQRLTEASTDLAQVQAEIVARQQEIADTAGAGSAEYATLSAEMELLTFQEQDLQAQVDAANQTIGEATRQIDELSAATEAQTGEAEAAVAMAEEQTAAQGAQSASAEELSETTRTLASTVDTLSAALQEQASAGTLSLDTALELIDAGYAAALAIDTETGAITINKDAYASLAQAKVDEQIAALEAARASENARLVQTQEAEAVVDNAEAHLRLAEARAAAEDEIKSYDAQIATLKQLRSTIGKTTTTVTASAAAGKKAATQAEKDLETYKDIRDELDHLLNMGQVTEEAYYDRLAELRDEYLTDSENLSEYRKINEEIYKYDQNLAEQESDLWAEQTKTLVDELESRLDDVISARDEMASTLSEYGDLFDIEDDELVINSLQDQIDMLDRYDQMLQQLQERGISDGLLGDVASLGVEDAVKYGEELLSMTDEQFEEYNDLWLEKQEKAIEIATKFYQDQLDTLQTEYNDKLGNALDSLVDTSYDSGIDTAQGLADGINDNRQAAIDAARDLADAVAAAMNSALDINSPSGVTEETGRDTARGFEVGFTDEMADIRGRMAQSSSAADAANSAAAGIVNGLSGVMPNGGGTYQINIMVGDTQLASVLFDPLHDVAAQRGRSIG